MAFRTIVAAAAISLLGGVAAQAELLDDIKEKGELSCGTLNYLPGVGFLNDKGEWSGFNVDFCKAAAAAILGAGRQQRFHTVNVRVVRRVVLVWVVTVPVCSPASSEANPSFRRVAKPTRPVISASGFR